MNPEAAEAKLSISIEVILLNGSDQKWIGQKQIEIAKALLVQVAMMPNMTGALAAANLPQLICI